MAQAQSGGRIKNASGQWIVITLFGSICITIMAGIIIVYLTGLSCLSLYQLQKLIRNDITNRH